MLAKSDEQKIYQKTNKKIEHMENILELIDTDDMHKEKATLIALMDLLSHGGMTEKYNIKIQIEYAHEDLQKYLESLFPDVNAGEVIDNARKFIMKEKGKSNVIFLNGRRNVTQLREEPWCKYRGFFIFQLKFHSINRHKYLQKKGGIN